MNNRLRARLTSSALAVTSALWCIVCRDRSETATIALADRIGRIENGMLPAVLIAGEDQPKSTVWEIMERYRVPGVSVAVINDGRLEWARGYGVVESGGSAVNTETLFFAGHISQGLAAAVTLRLAGDRSLSLDDDVNDRLVSWAVPENEFTRSEKVTLRRVLSHASGLNIPTFRGYGVDERLPSLRQILDGEPPARNQPIEVVATPGSEQRYSLGGYVVLQQFVEDVSGSSYPELLRTTVLSRAGLRRTFPALVFLWLRRPGSFIVPRPRQLSQTPSS